MKLSRTVIDISQAMEETWLQSVSGCFTALGISSLVIEMALLACLAGGCRLDDLFLSWPSEPQQFSSLVLSLGH